MAARTPRPIERRRLGIELRQLRAAANLTLEDVATHFSWSVSKSSRMERGLVPVTARDIRDLAAFYGITDPDRLDHLVNLTAGTRPRDWWRGYDDLLARQFSIYLGFEADASSLHSCETLIVPGLLQTADYARALLQAGYPTGTDQDTARFVEARLRRQELLDTDDAPHLSVVLDEAVLHRQVGGPAIMRAQLDHLLTAATKPNITIQVVPYQAGAYMSMEGGFILLRFQEPTDPDIVGVDTLTRSLYIDDPGEVIRYILAYEYLLARAATPTDSTQLIAAAREETPT